MLSAPWVSEFLIQVFADAPEAAHVEWYAVQSPFSVLYVFLFGVLIYYALKENKLGVVTLWFIVLLLVTSFEWNFYELFFSLMLVIMVSLPPMVKNVRVNRAVVELARMSFSLYLLHSIIMELLDSYAGDMPKGTASALCIYVVVPVIVTYIVDRWCIRPIEVWLEKTLWKKGEK